MRPRPLDMVTISRIFLVRTVFRGTIEKEVRAMIDITYEMIQPNVANITTNGSAVEVSWKCAETGKDMGRSTAQQQADNSVGGKVLTTVKQSVFREIGYGIVSFISSLLGGSAGRIARDATWSASSQLQSRANAASYYNESTRRAAVIQAFKEVQSKFNWSEEKKHFFAK